MRGQTIECFKAEESPYYPGRWTIVPIHEKFHLDGLPKDGGSYSVICARLMNLSYAQYLRFCRDVLKAEVYGKNSLYPVPYFKNNGILRQFVRLLNNRASVILWARNHPDWENTPEAAKILGSMGGQNVCDD